MAGAAHDLPSLDAAVAADPDFLLARVGLAAARAARGGPFELGPEPRTLTRAERHHVEIVPAFARGDCAHAVDLRREHLLEYPADLLVVWGPQLCPG